jgi:hypothetical protein
MIEIVLNDLWTLHPLQYSLLYLTLEPDSFVQSHRYHDNRHCDAVQLNPESAAR